MSLNAALQITEVNETGISQGSAKATPSVNRYISETNEDIEFDFDEFLSKPKLKYINADYLSINPDSLPSGNTVFGRVEERWDIINYYPARIVEIKESFVFLDCVVDRESSQIELWKFKREIIGDSCDLKEGNIILITYLQRPGKITYTFQNANNLHYGHYFSLEGDFSEKWAGQRLR